MSDNMTKAAAAEKSIIKKYRKELWNPFIAACKRYCLIEEGDRIAVCISGGKDSFLLALLLKILNRYSEFPFSLEYICMDPGFDRETREGIEKNAKELDIPVIFFKNRIFEIANKDGGNPCYLCARMRRGALYAKAKELSCNKIALGHHMNDVIETTLISMFYSSQLSGMMPKIKSANCPGMELIRPLYCIKEEDILKFKRYNGLEFASCSCAFAGKTEESKRAEVKALIKELKKSNKDIETSIFNAVHQVDTGTFPGLRRNGRKIDFENIYSSAGTDQDEESET